MIKLTELTSLKGEFELKVFRNGKLLQETTEKNLVVNGAGDALAHLLAGEPEGKHITTIAFGTQGDLGDKDVSTITGEWAKSISGFSYPEIGRVTFHWELGTGENNGMAISEFGLLCEDGTLFARRVRVDPLFKQEDISLEGHWTIIFNT